VSAIFPRWTNSMPIVVAILAPIAGAALIFFAWYYLSPSYTDVGYRPIQPVAYSHKLHAGDMGMDCRYCHNTVEVANHAAIPPTQTCMNCHSQVKTDSPRLELVRESYKTGESIPWVKVHQLPDYAYFPHQNHIAAGVGCASCHGRVDQMVVVETKESLSMGWCLECHRNPEPHLRPLDKVTDMTWNPAEHDYDADKDPARKRKVNPPEHCGACHR
jgi:hypothetical protein